MYEINNVDKKPLLNTNNPKGFQPKYPFDAMLIGDFFDIPLSETTKHNVRSLISYHNGKNKGYKKFSSKSIKEIVRVTRIY